MDYSNSCVVMLADRLMEVITVELGNGYDGLL